MTSLALYCLVTLVVGGCACLTGLLAVVGRQYSLGFAFYSLWALCMAAHAYLRQLEQDGG